MIHGHVSPALAAALPPEVVDALELLPGDPIAYVIDDNGVRISRAPDDESPDLGLTTEQLKVLIQEALNDPRPPVPAEQAFEAIFKHIQRRRDGV